MAEHADRKGLGNLAHKGEEMCSATIVPEGPYESSPVRSAGLVSKKSGPSRMGRSTPPHACETTPERPGAKRFDRPGRTSLLHHVPPLVLGWSSNGGPLSVALKAIAVCEPPFMHTSHDARMRAFPEIFVQVAAR